MPNRPEISTGPNASAQPATLGSTPRPSLAGGGIAGPQPVSMLASLERPAHRAASRKTSPLSSIGRWPWIAAGGLLLAGLAAAGWLASNRISDATSAPVSMTAGLPSPAPGAPAVAAEPVEVASAPAASARIEVMEPAALAAPANPLSQARIEAPSGAASAALPAQRVADAKARRPVKQTPAATKPHRDKRTSPTHAHAASRQAQEKARRDGDAELLAALMAHVTPPRPVSSTPARPVDNAAIAKQMRHCDALAHDASRRCRQHVCEGVQGKAKACAARATGIH